MKMTIESTERLVLWPLDETIPVRLWRGTTESGAPVHAFIALVATPAESSDGGGSLLHEIEPFPAPSPQRPPGGRFAFADDADPLVSAASRAASLFATAMDVGVREGSIDPVSLLDGLATCYVHELVRQFGEAAARHQLAILADGVGTIAQAQRTSGLGQMPRQGRA